MPIESIDVQVARIDERTAHLARQISTMHEENRRRLDEQDRKLDRLMEGFNMGRGWFVATAKIGGLVLMGLAAAGWVIDHIVGWMSKP